MLNEIKQLINELFYKGVTINTPRLDSEGEYLEIFKNPDRKELFKQLIEFKDSRDEHGARFTVTDGNLYYWDGGILHEEMSQMSGIPIGDIKGTFYWTAGSIFVVFEANILYNFDSQFNIDDYYENPYDPHYGSLRDKVDDFINSNDLFKRLMPYKIEWEM